MSRVDAASRIRSFLLASLAFGIVGTVAELILLGHVESAQQWIPIGLCALATLVLVWHVAAPQLGSVRALQATMVLFVLSGLVGVGLHFRGNVEFELEMYPSMSGLELVTKTLTGATPVLAPGSMTLMGLIGLSSTYRHPLLQRDAIKSLNE